MIPSPSGVLQVSVLSDIAASSALGFLRVRSILIPSVRRIVYGAERSYTGEAFIFVEEPIDDHFFSDFGIFG